MSPPSVSSARNCSGVMVKSSHAISSMHSKPAREPTGGACSLWQGSVSVVAASGISGSHCRQCQACPGSCHHWPEPQSGQALSGLAAKADPAGKFSGCTWFRTDNADIVSSASGLSGLTEGLSKNASSSVSTLSVRKCVHCESALSSLSRVSVLPKRLFEFSMSIVSTRSALLLGFSATALPPEKLSECLWVGTDTVDTWLQCQQCQQWQHCQCECLRTY